MFHIQVRQLNARFIRDRYSPADKPYTTASVPIIATAAPSSHPRGVTQRSCQVLTQFRRLPFTVRYVLVVALVFAVVAIHKLTFL